MSTELETLIQDRSDWVKLSQKIKFSEGITRLLTELYPDNAHFIYELLQNAEDPQATTVHFKLTDSSLEFTHDGKRLFSFTDVESITSIGNSTKRDDATSIGKFGVGFKAVFAYTNTPEIHSGDFHFRIRDLVVPDTEGVKPLTTNPQKTHFIFPFDNPQKPTAAAVREISKGLQALDGNSLLFLSHIRQIEYTLPDGRKGSLRREDHENGQIDIHVTAPNNKTIVSRWLHFQKEVSVSDDNGESKICRIAIAYSLVKDTDKKTSETSWKIVPLDHGKVSIYFPAEKETSNLRFHIHAPFASTVARDSVRDCKANSKLRDYLAKLIVESFSKIKEQGLLTISFLATLPNETDNLSPFYEQIRLEIVRKFQMHPITPTRNKRYAAARKLYRGPSKIAEVINDEDLSIFTGEKTPLWVANPPQHNQREDRFLENLDIQRWSWGELSSTFRKFRGAELENWLSSKPDKWLMSFYALLAEAYNNSRQSIPFSDAKIIRVSTKQSDIHVTPSQAHFPPAEGISAPANTFFVKKTVYANGRSDEQKRLSKLFLEKSGVLPFDTKQVVKLKLDFYQTQPEPIPKQYWDDIKMFCEFWHENKHSNTEIFKNKVFLRAKSRDGTVSWCKPSDTYIDKPFADTGLGGLFNQDTVKLEKYKSEILENYYLIPNFTEFALTLGVMDRLEISEHLATEMQKDIFQTIGRKTDTTVDKDYFINSIVGGWTHKSSNFYIGILPITNRNKSISYAIWKTVCRVSHSQLTALYIPNQSKLHLRKSTNAHFIKQLANSAWIPDRESNFLKPEDLTVETLHPDFYPDNTNGWLTAIKFGENSRKLSEAYQAKNNKAQEFGFQSAERASKWAELDKLGISPDELLAKQKPIEQPEKSVPNPDRRRKGVLELSENAPSKESVMRERSIQPGISAIQADAKAYLRAIYTNKNGEMVCQCCQKEMPFKIGDDYYFEAIQCFKNSQSHYIQNRLALCPVCSAMYQHARQTDDNQIKNLITTIGSNEAAASVSISINLVSNTYNLRFVESHWFDLKTIILNLK